MKTLNFIEKSGNFCILRIFFWSRNKKRRIFRKKNRIFQKFSKRQNHEEISSPFFRAFRHFRNRPIPTTTTTTKKRRRMDRPARNRDKTEKNTRKTDGKPTPHHRFSPSRSLLLLPPTLSLFPAPRRKFVGEGGPPLFGRPHPSPGAVRNTLPLPRVGLFGGVRRGGGGRGDERGGGAKARRGARRPLFRE